jgi:hypothetical protein
MNIGKFDISLLFILSFAIVLISFTGPVFGLTTADATNSSEIPNLTVGSNQFDVAGEFPEQPGNPSGGELVFTENTTNGFGINQVFVTGSSQGDNDGTEVVVINSGTSGSPEGQIIVNEWNSGVLIKDTKFNFTSEGEEFVFQNKSSGLVVEFESTNITTNAGGGNTQVAAEYNVVQTPSDTGPISSLPLIGGIVSGASALAGIVGWIGSIIFFLFLTLGETILNAAITLTDVTVYLISMVGWMFSTYLGVVSGAPGWARVIVAMPSVLLAAVLAKFVAVGVSLLPTT